MFTCNCNAARYHFSAQRIAVSIKFTVSLQADSTAASIISMTKSTICIADIDLFDIISSNFSNIFIDYIKFTLKCTNSHITDSSIWIYYFTTPITNIIIIVILTGHKNFIV